VSVSNNDNASTRVGSREWFRSLSDEQQCEYLLWLRNAAANLGVTTDNHAFVAPQPLNIVSYRFSMQSLN
jgi:hypothetical protein